MNRPALRALLQTRARVLAAIRDFFAARGVLEVTTPALSPFAPSDPALASLELEVTALGGRRFLSTSPEFAMKRLLAAGSGDIYELARVFRDGELGRWHEPEFLLLEWYRLGFTERELMDEVMALLETALAARLAALARLDVSYADAFGAAFGIDPHALDAAGRARLCSRLAARGIDVPPDLTGSGLLDLALVTAIVPEWPRDTAVFLYDYPLEQAALAAVRPGPGPVAVAARFEVFVNGLELGNGFRELTDAAEQRRRFESDLAARRAAGLPEPPIDERLLAALEQGLPDCAGVALGVDRLIALVAGSAALADAVVWPHGRRARDHERGSAHER